MFASLACSSTEVGDEASETGETETGETETGEPSCPPDPLPWPLECTLEPGCAHLTIENANYDPGVAVCILEALRDRRVGSYSFFRSGGFSADDYVFQILDDTYLQWVGYGVSDDGGGCGSRFGITAIQPPEIYADCLALGPGNDQADCFVSITVPAAPEPALAECPLP